MWRFATILLVIALAAAVLAIRHRQELRAINPAPSSQVPSRDVADTLRAIQGAGEPKDKPWARQFAAFVNAHPGRQWLVGKCERPCLSEAEAADEARADAASQLYPIVLERTGSRRLDAGWLGNQIQKDVASGRLDADRCVEKFDRPYGQIWAESVLLDVSPDRIEPLVAGYRAELNARHARVMRHVLAACVLIGATWLAYLLIDAITRGYFTGRLRLIAGIMTVAVIAILV